MLGRQIITTPNAPAALGPYSQANVWGNLVFASGQLGLSKEGVLVGNTIEEQTRQSITNIQEVLTAAGSSLDQVVKTTVFLLDMNDFAAMNKIYGEYFGENSPARSTIQVARLPKDGLVEIEVIAYRD